MTTDAILDDLEGSLSSSVPTAVWAQALLEAKITPMNIRDRADSLRAVADLFNETAGLVDATADRLAVHGI